MPRGRRGWTIAGLALAAGGGALAFALRPRLYVAPAIVVSDAYDHFADTLRGDETLGALLQQAGIVGRSYAAFLTAARALDPRRLRPGLVFSFRRVKGAPEADRMTVRPSPEEWLVYERTADGWSERVLGIPWDTTRLRITGTITTSLYDALDSAVPDSVLPPGERVQLAWALADVYDWEVDFTRDVRAGDRFEVLIERLEAADGERRFGRILAARVDAGGQPNFAFRFVSADGRTTGYYDDQGRSLRRAFLRAPLQFRRISSRFGNRYHPILHRWRRHEGIDFAAAYGTPVRATADGVVSRLTYEADGYGNMIELRHANGIRTRYGHLSHYAKGLHLGERVTQGQIIGYVGSTGLSTGPHLHYEFLVNGHATNPQRRDMGAGTPVPAALRAVFDSDRAALLAALETPRLAGTIASGD